MIGSLKYFQGILKSVGASVVSVGIAYLGRIAGTTGATNAAISGALIFAGVALANIASWLSGLPKGRKARVD